MAETQPNTAGSWQRDGDDLELEFTRLLGEYNVLSAEESGFASSYDPRINTTTDRYDSSGNPINSFIVMSGKSSRPTDERLYNGAVKFSQQVPSRLFSVIYEGGKRLDDGHGCYAQKFEEVSRVSYSGEVIYRHEFDLENTERFNLLVAILALKKVIAQMRSYTMGTFEKAGDNTFVNTGDGETINIEPGDKFTEAVPNREQGVVWEIVHYDPAVGIFHAQSITKSTDPALSRGLTRLTPGDIAKMKKISSS